MQVKVFLEEAVEVTLPDIQGGVLNSGNLTYSCRITLVGRKNRLNKLLADSNICLGVEVSDLHGQSAAPWSRPSSPGSNLGRCSSSSVSDSRQLVRSCSMRYKMNFR